MTDEKKKHSILIVDDENLNILALTNILGAEYTVFAAKNGQKAISAAEKFLPDIILLDIIMPVMDGYSVITALKHSKTTRHIPVIFISGLSNADNEEKGLSLGAADYISKPFSPSIVKLRVNYQIQILRQIRTIERLTMRDQLTDILNRRGLDKHMNVEWIQASKDNAHISILLIDVDHFKKYNDTYGHQQGDVALQAIATTLTKSLNRSEDIAARWGGEEFVVLLPNTDQEGALVVAERIRKNIGSVVIPCADGTETKVTASIGVGSQTSSQGNSIDDLFSDADIALYKAKKTGRDRVCVP